MFKLVLKYLSIGIVAGCFFFALNIMLKDLLNSDQLYIFFNNPTAYILGFLVIGIGFYGCGIVYEIDHLKFKFKLIIHAFVGIGLFMLVGFSLGLFTLNNPLHLIVNIAINIGIILALWTVLYIRDRNELQIINKALIKQNLSEEV